MSDPLAPIRAAVAGRYEIEREISQGAFATIYSAHDLRHERRVAFKVLNADASTEIGEIRFIREIRLLARLQHPNILPLIDSGHVGSLLYYVMPFVGGETLRGRMDRERQMALDAAITITRDAADALHYAHLQGVIHRDIKPDNILLSAGHSVIADFGVAQAIDLAAPKHLTRTGSGSPGTPAYMSPEQLMADRKLDGRSDTYSLGCVLYEMLTGRMPFAGKEGFVKRFTDPPPVPSVFRKEIPAALDEAVVTAMAREPADRYATANEFCRALAGVRLGAASTSGRKESAVPPSRTRPSAYPSSPSAYAPRGVLPIATPGAAGPAADGSTKAARSPELRERHAAIPSAVEPARTAGRASASGSEVPARIEQGPAARPASIDAVPPVRGEGMPRLRWAIAGASIALVAALAFASHARGDRLQQARRGLQDGKVSDAVADLRPIAADSHDPSAALWLAQALLATGVDTGAELQRAVRLASTGAGGLPALDAARARALTDLASRKFGTACPALRELRRMQPDDPLVALDLGVCLASDIAVVPDPASPSTWRFRTSRQEAVRTLQGVLDQLPEGHEARVAAFRAILSLLTTEWGQFKPGVGADDSTRAFVSFPALDRGPAGDTIAYVPYPRAVARPGQRWMNPPSLSRAFDHDRELLRSVAAGWVRERPRDPDAHTTLARALELRGELAEDQTGRPSALHEIREARRLATRATDVLNLEVAQVRVHVKNGDFGSARAAAESAIAMTPVVDSATRARIASLLAITGRARELARLSAGGATDYVERMPDGTVLEPHPVLAATVLAFGAYAYLGGPVDSLLALRDRAERDLRSYVAPRARDSARVALLAWPLSASVPSLGVASALTLPSKPGLIDAQRTLARGDRAATLQILNSITNSDARRMHPAAGIHIDAVLAEAWLRTAAGDSAGGARQLDDALNGLSALGTLYFRTVPDAAALGRAMIFRAALAQRNGEVAIAKRWLDGARQLWKDADPELRPR